MDDVRITRIDAPAPRPRRRWPVALLACALLAPLTSGSAAALSGGSADKPAAKPATSKFSVQYDKDHLCRKDEFRKRQSKGAEY